MVISLALRKEGILPASRCDLMMRQPRLRCRYVRPNEKKASGQRSAEQPSAMARLVGVHPCPFWARWLCASAHTLGRRLAAFSMI